MQVGMSYAIEDNGSARYKRLYVAGNILPCSRYNIVGDGREFHPLTKIITDYR